MKTFRKKKKKKTKENNKNIRPFFNWKIGMPWLTGVWTQFFLKHIECCNFQIITEMYIEVYISGMEMSQWIHFWYQILLKMIIFWENGKKNHFFGVKNAQISGNHVKTHV